MRYKSKRTKLWRRSDTFASFPTKMQLVKTTVTVYYVIWYTLLFSLYFLEQKIKILEYKMSDANILPSTSLCIKNWNSKCLKLSVNNRNKNIWWTNKYFSSEQGFPRCSWPIIIYKYDQNILLSQELCWKV
jgi:hypothetical protein